MNEDGKLLPPGVTVKAEAEGRQDPRHFKVLSYPFDADVGVEGAASATTTATTKILCTVMSKAKIRGSLYKVAFN